MKHEFTKKGRLTIANNDNQDYLGFKQPVLAVGIGGLGIKLAINSSKLLDCKCVLISNDKKDLDESHFSVLIHSDVCINPSSYKLLSLSEASAKIIRSA